MRLIDLVSGLWMIAPGVLEEIQQVYETHLKGEKIDLKGLEMRAGVAFQNRPEPGYVLENDTAIISLEGPITRKRNLFTYLFGGTSSEETMAALAEALTDPKARQIELRVNSPGGTADGTQELAYAVYNARGQKPITAKATGMITSAAYYIGAAADRIELSSDMTMVGSIGVRTSHVDVSKMYDAMGVKVTDISAGEGKTLGSPYRPLSKEDRKAMEKSIEYTYEVFVNDVARFRNMDPQKIRSLGAWIYEGQEAVAAGLADGVTLAKQPHSKTKANQTKMAAGVAAAEGGRTMKPEELKELHPETWQAVFDAGAASVPKFEPVDVEAVKSEARAEGMLAGATAERERIQTVRAQLLPGHEDLIESFVADGKTTGEQAAVAVLKAVREEGMDMLAALRNGSNKPAAPVPAADPKPAEQRDFVSLVNAHMATAKCSRSEAIAAIAAQHPEAHAAYVAACNAKK